MSILFLPSSLEHGGHCHVLLAEGTTFFLCLDAYQMIETAMKTGMRYVSVKDTFGDSMVLVVDSIISIGFFPDFHLIEYEEQELARRKAEAAFNKSLEDEEWKP